MNWCNITIYNIQYTSYIMIETSDYWIIENKFIFKPLFNKKLDKQLDNYIDLISKYDELIFSNFLYLNILINNNYINNYKDNFNLVNNYLSSFFNNEIKFLPTNLKSVIFGEKFNKPVNLPLNLRSVIFDDEFNQPITLPPNLTHLTLGYTFNQPINLPCDLTHLTLGYTFNQLVNLPNIKYLSLSNNNKNIVDMLPSSIEELELGPQFNSPLDNLPNNLKKLVFKYDYTSFLSYNYNYELNNLPNSLEYLKLKSTYSKPIINFPVNLKIIECYEKYSEYINELKNKYEIKIIPKFNYKFAYESVKDASSKIPVS